MKVTTHLSAWLMGRIQEAGWSWREVGRRTGLSDMTVRRVANGLVDELEAKTEDAICQLFRISTEDLRAISEGLPNNHGLMVRDNVAGYSVDCDKQSLWSWVAQDQQRSAVLRAMGFAGTLPAPKEQLLGSGLNNKEQ